MFSGLLYYALLRHSPTNALFDISQGAFPSFAFVLAFTLLSIPFSRGEGSQRLIPGLGWLAIVLAIEPLFGTFDVLDLFAAIAGFATAASISRWHADTPSLRLVNPAAEVLVLMTGVALLTGCYTVDLEEFEDDPIYLSYSDLRSSVRVEAPREMTAMGSLYLYGDYLFINEKNKGLHVINNANPSEPFVAGFINIPGNTSVSVRDGFLYADSFIDLVVLDVRDASNIQEISRQVDVFPYDAYQMITDPVYFYDLDSDNGVVIGYE